VHVHALPKRWDGETVMAGWEMADLEGDRIGEVRAVFDSIDMTDPRSAFALGLAYGMALARELTDAEDDMIHRAAAVDVTQIVTTVDRWRIARDPS
jgi:hypothetical protein